MLLLNHKRESGQREELMGSKQSVVNHFKHQHPDHTACTDDNRSINFTKGAMSLNILNISKMQVFLWFCHALIFIWQQLHKTYTSSHGVLIKDRLLHGPGEIVHTPKNGMLYLRNDPTSAPSGFRVHYAMLRAFSLCTYHQQACDTSLWYICIVWSNSCISESYSMD